jgi:hypothetical protein
MSLTLATLILGILLLALGAVLLVSNSAIVTGLKRLPRSQSAAYLFFGAGAAWFLYRIWHLSAADFGDFRIQLFVFFALVGILAFRYVPDFLAVRGMAILVLLGSVNLLGAGYMEWTYGELWDGGRIYLYKVAVIAAVALAIYLGAAPYRLRDFFDWLFRQPRRPRVLGGALAAYGVALCVTALTY